MSKPLPEYMHSFEEDAGKESIDPNQPPNCLNTTALDKNFAACLPISDDGVNAPYKVEADEDGWRLVPQLIFDVCENGTPRRVKLFGQKIGAIVPQT